VAVDLKLTQLMSRQVIIIEDPNPWGEFIFFAFLLLIAYAYFIGFPEVQDEGKPKKGLSSSKQDNKRSIDASELHTLSDTEKHQVCLMNCKVVNVYAKRGEDYVILESRGAGEHNYILVTTTAPHPAIGETTNVYGTLIFVRNSNGSRGARLLNARFD